MAECPVINTKDTVTFFFCFSFIPFSSLAKPNPCQRLPQMWRVGSMRERCLYCFGGTIITPPISEERACPPRILDGPVFLLYCFFYYFLVSSMTAPSVSSRPDEQHADASMYVAGRTGPARPFSGTGRPQMDKNLGSKLTETQARAKPADTTRQLGLSIGRR